MKIGYIVQGSSDRGALNGLKDRWCPSAELQLLHFRGSKARHRDYPKIFEEARLKGMDVVIILTDSDIRNWGDVLKEEQDRVPSASAYSTIIGVADRNIECWLCADRDYAAKWLGCHPNDLKLEDPKGVFQRLMGITHADKKEPEIARFVRDAPTLKMWIRNSRSFKRFYDDARRLSAARGCQIRNEQDPN